MFYTHLSDINRKPQQVFFFLRRHKLTYIPWGFPPWAFPPPRFAGENFWKANLGGGSPRSGEPIFWNLHYLFWNFWAKNATYTTSFEIFWPFFSERFAEKQIFSKNCPKIAVRRRNFWQVEGGRFSRKNEIRFPVGVGRGPIILSKGLIWPTVC